MERQSRPSHITSTHSAFAHPRELRLDPRTIVVPLFFEKHVFPAEFMKLSSRGHFDHLVKMYSNAAPSSPLALATFATATRAIASHLSFEEKDSWLFKNDLAAAQALRKAIADPKESLRDSTLLAVLCLDFGTQYSKTDDALTAPSRPHLDGALALIHHRGPRNFKTAISRALFTATRSNALLQALWYGDQRSQDAIASFPDKDTGLANPVTKLQCILLRALQLNGPTSTHMSSRERDACIQDLQTRLHAWLHAIPTEWKSVFEDDPAPGSWPPAGTIDLIPCLHVASLLAQYLCTKFMILKFTLTHTHCEHAPNDTQGQNAAACKNYKTEAQAIATKVHRLLTHLESKFPSPTTTTSTENELHSFNISGVDSGPSLSDTARVISFNLSRWAVAEFSAQMPRCGGFDIAGEVLDYLRSEREKGLALVGKRAVDDGGVGKRSVKAVVPCNQLLWSVD